ncbi:MAG TPA: glycosyltransferase family 4 protein [Acidimicrobiales bacterium]|nr:glycosyltransferase family 4 protein [Acidimicrobiales bacterium]
MKLAFLWPQMSGYVDACLRATADLGHHLYLAHRAAGPEAPFRDERFGWIERRHCYAGEADPQRLLGDLEDFGPDAILAVSWHRPAFRAVLRRWRGRALRVLFMDNPWRGTPKQWAGRLVARSHVLPYYDAAFLPGERQAVFARMLGFDDDAIWQGAYVADNAAFDTGPRSAPPARPSFLLCARLVPEKGVEDLAEAWATATADGAVEGWRLQVAGVGPLAERMADLADVEMLGFVQPDELPAIHAAAGALVLPSRVEHWGVAVNEACAAGLPIIATTAVGATTGLLREGINGWVVPPRRPDLLAGRLADTARLPAADWARMSDRSRALSTSYTPEGWARYFTAQCTRALGAQGSVTA